jgi:hypothetical protein
LLGTVIQRNSGISKKSVSAFRTALGQQPLSGFKMGTGHWKDQHYIRGLGLSASPHNFQGGKRGEG